MSALADALGPLAAVLDRRGVTWFVFGAQAVAVRGAPRATQDLDVTVLGVREDLPSLVADLQRAGFQHRYPQAAQQLIEAGAVLPLVHTASGFEVDLVLAGSGFEELAAARATREPVDGVCVPVAHATDLVVMKILAGRGKDIDDTRSLLAGDDVDAAEVRDLLGQLEAALGQSDLVPAFDALWRERRRERG
jgi:hypothetical protein